MAYDGPEGIETARTYGPDVLLLDIGLPDLDGYEVARRLRREENSKRALMIAISGYGQEDDQRRSREAGIDHYLVKPVDIRTITNLIQPTEPSHQSSRNGKADIGRMTMVLASTARQGAGLRSQFGRSTRREAGNLVVGRGQDQALPASESRTGLARDSSSASSKPISWLDGNGLRDPSVRAPPLTHHPPTGETRRWA